MSFRAVGDIAPDYDPTKDSRQYECVRANALKPGVQSFDTMCKNPVNPETGYQLPEADRLRACEKYKEFQNDYIQAYSLCAAYMTSLTEWKAAQNKPAPAPAPYTPPYVAPVAPKPTVVKAAAGDWGTAATLGILGVGGIALYYAFKKKS